MHPMIHDLIERLKAGHPISIAGLGDSLTYGWMVERSYFDRFVDALVAGFPGATIHRVNSGVPGSTAHDGLRRIEGVLSGRPDLVILQFGLNDFYQGVDCSAFEGQIEALTLRTLEAGSRVLVTTSCPVRDPALQLEVDAFYSVLGEVAKRHEVPVAELHQFWARATPPAGTTGLYQSDGVHPTDAGHVLMSQGLIELFALPL